jgi:hypothetical protein
LLNARAMYKTLILSLALFGCGAAPEDDDNVPVVEGKDDAFSFLPAPGDTAPWLYFDNTEVATIDAPHYWRFTAKESHSFTIQERALVAGSTSGATDTKGKVGFKLYRLARSNHYYWKQIGEADSKKGVATLSYKGSASHYYLLEASAGSFPTDISVNMTCAGGNHAACSFGGQPRDACGTNANDWCGNGLFCQFESGCGTQAGECAVQPTVCPRGIACFPVCGCDGKTYCMGCDIASHGQSVAHMGTCDCDLNQFEDADNVTPNGTYQFIDTGKTHYTYTFSAGTFTSERDPGCMFSNPRCEIAVMPRHGAFTVNFDDTVTLNYDDGTSATLFTQTNCAGTDQLVITDYGVTFTATHI